MSRLLARTLLACALAASTAACAAVLGFERLTEEGAPDAATAETGTDGGPAPPAEAGSACTSVGIPERPSATDAGTTGPGPFHVAVKLVDFGIDTNVGPVGYNLDRACSPSTAESTCTTSVSDEVFTKYAKDKDDKGLDSAGFALIQYLAFLGSAFRPDAVNERLADGEYGIVLRVSGWNGAPDDDDVLVEVFPAIGLWTREDAGLVPGGKPAFQKSDLWRRDRRFQNVVDASTIKSTNAWVKGGRLVASFESVTMPLSVPDDPKPLEVRAQEGFLTASLVPDGASFRLADGVVGGRWRTVDFLEQVRNIYIKDTAGITDKVLCDPNLAVDVYGAVKREICQGRDIRGASREDGKGMACDAFSVGLRVDSYAIDEAGEFADLPAIAPRCQQPGSVPKGDDCPTAAP